MPNALPHRLGAAAVMAIAVSSREEPDPSKQAVAACGGALFGTLPDLLEPASNPRHRQFFHSLACAALVGYACHRLYHWQPETVSDQFVRGALLIAGGSFLTHLAMDAFSPQGLPLL